MSEIWGSHASEDTNYGSFDLWCHVYLVISVSVKCITSTPGVTSTIKKDEIHSPETMVTRYENTTCHNPDDEYITRLPGFSTHICPYLLTLAYTIFRGDTRHFAIWLVGSMVEWQQSPQGLYVAWVWSFSWTPCNFKKLFKEKVSDDKW
jgi:hypothetical protein